MRCTRRTLLRAGVVGGVSLLAGCEGTVTLEDKRDEPVGESSDDPLEASQFYQGIRLADADDATFAVTVAESLDVNEKGNKNTAKCEQLVLRHDDRQLAAVTPVFGTTTYRFPGAGDGSYRLVGTGDFDFSNGLSYEVETELEFERSGGRVTPQRVLFTRQGDSDRQL